MMEFVSNNLRWLSFMNVPLMAIAARFIFFRKELNFIEHFVLPFYVLGHYYWVAIISVFDLALFGQALPTWVTIPINMFYFGWGYRGLMKTRHSFLKGVGVYLTGQLLIGLVGVLVLVVTLMVNPELRELIRPSNNP